MNDTPANPTPCPVVEVMGMPLWAVDTKGLIGLMVDRAAAAVPSRVCYVNAHSWNLARRDPEFRRSLVTADVLYADGMSMVWASRVLGSPLPCRLSSADYVQTFAHACARRGLSVYLLGGRPGVAERAAGRLVRIAEGLNVAGTFHGHFDLSDGADAMDQVNRAHPDILLVGMGSPRQETWVARNREHLRVPVVWTVGALFDYLADVEVRAPQWMCRAGLEWVFRLAMDPLGKCRRYLVGNPVFAAAVLAACLRKAFSGGCRWRKGAVLG